MMWQRRLVSIGICSEFPLCHSMDPTPVPWIYGMLRDSSFLIVIWNKWINNLFLRARINKISYLCHLLVIISLGQNFYILYGQWNHYALVVFSRQMVFFLLICPDILYFCYYPENYGQSIVIKIVYLNTLNNYLVFGLLY